MYHLENDVYSITESNLFINLVFQFPYNIDNYPLNIPVIQLNLKIIMLKAVLISTFKEAIRFVFMKENDDV